VNDLTARLPARRLAMVLVRRGITLWALTRAMLLAVGLSIGAPSHMSPLAAVLLVFAVGGLGVLESRRLNEHRFFANLGVSPTTAALFILLPALIGEVAVGVALWQ